MKRLYVVGVSVELEAGGRVSAMQGADRVEGMALDVHRGGEGVAAACSRVDHSLAISVRLWSKTQMNALGWRGGPMFQRLAGKQPL